MTKENVKLKTKKDATNQIYTHEKRGAEKDGGRSNVRTYTNIDRKKSKKGKGRALSSSAAFFLVNEKQPKQSGKDGESIKKKKGFCDREDFLTTVEVC